MEQENLRRRLIATARSLKKQKQRLKAAQDTLNSRWNKVLINETKYGGSYHTNSYPKRKLLPEFDDEAVPPKNNTTRRPDVPLHNHNRAATDAAHDLREHLEKKAGAARSIYGSKRDTPARDYGRQNNYDNQTPV